MHDLKNSTTGRTGSSESGTRLGLPYLRKQSIGLSKFVITSALIVGFSVCLSAKAFADDEHHYGDDGRYSRHHYSRRDRTAPVIQVDVNGTQGANGWYTSDVSISWNVSDPESSVSSTSGCSSVSLTSDTNSVTYICQATSRGGTNSRSVTIKRDATPPKPTLSTPADGASYAQGQPVRASYSCTDGTSGVSSCTGTVANGANIDVSGSGTKTFSVNATDQAGNTATATASYTVTSSTQDTTPPVITPTVNGTLGANGWYTSNVSVSWNVTDAESTVSNTSGCNNVSISTDTAGVTYTCQATSQGGSSSKSVTVKRDATPPKATIVSPAGGATYIQGQTVNAGYSCSDATSGVSSCTGTIANGASLDLSSTGSRSFSVSSSDQAGNQTSSSISYSVSAGGNTGGSDPVDSAPGTHLFAWNDLGMHCADSDFSVFTLLPPFNDLNAQLVVNNRVVNGGSSGYFLTYESTPDPTGSVNTFSQTKTNFWEYDLPLFGADLTPDYGLTGNPTPSFNPAPLAWSPEFNWFEATGIPITPVDDNLNTNYFPMVRVIAFDGTGTAIASTDTVLPISSEINCDTCHASNTGSAAAQPAAGWVNMSAEQEKDWRFNILRLHDELNGGAAYNNLLTQKGYGASLESSALAGTPVLCDTCHNSNALSVWGINGEKGISNMTAAMHNRHANVRLPGSSQGLDSIGTRDACFNCHPGRDTQCLRGAMGNPVDSTGKHTMECQSCHGSMATVGNAAREGWFDMPTCQSCHHDGKRETVAINPDGTFKTWNDSRFASNPDTPATGWSLYRFSTGHSGLQCEACHNSTHAEYTNVPSATNNQVNDNLQAIKAQGYAAAIRECTVCHATMPSTTSGGPHGMHPVGQTWVSGHEHASKTGCSYCHGTTSAGSPLAEMKVAKTLRADGRNVTFAVNQRVTCWSCHNGPNPD